jgi:tetratricopeptide (TPR) repeat protein
MSNDPKAQAQHYLQAGKVAFERGAYRQAVDALEQANALVNRTSRLGGDVQFWLVTAYQANGQTQEAIALCRSVSRHPDYETAKQGKRLLYILEAPKLKTRPEWKTEIPDLGSLDESDESTLMSKYAANRTRKSGRSRSRPMPPPKPIDPSQIDTKDNGFVWIALALTVLTLGSLVWLS